MNQLAIGKFISLKRRSKNLTQDYSIIKNLCSELEITVAEMLIGVYVIGKGIGNK